MNYVFVILALTISSVATAETPCMSTTVNFSLAAKSNVECASLKLEGPFMIRVCENGRSSLKTASGENKTIFKMQDSWLSRRATYDFSNGVSITETLSLPENFSTFEFYKVETSSNGVVKSRIACYGQAQ